MLAELIARTNPEVAGMPWYALGGYMNERTMVCIMHGVFTSTALFFLTRPADRALHEIAPQVSHNWRAFLLGVVCAMALHYLGNFPIYLVAVLAGVWPGVSKTVWQVALTVWINLFFIGTFILLIFLYIRQRRAGKKRGLLGWLFGYARCPECGHVYPRPWYGVNLSTFKKPTQRYEPCPACRKWHMTEALSQEEVERLRAEGKL